MKPRKHTPFVLVPFILIGCLAAGTASSAARNRAGAAQNLELDKKVQAFLDQHRRSWRDMNVSETDGKILHDLILENNYTRALEIGTSTGHSGIWMAWALSKTGGKLITVEIDEGRYREAVANFKESGLASFVDARLADAHELVPALKGTFDFIFIDADKDWYVNYARAVIPKLEAGGTITAHNVSAPRPGGHGWRRSGGAGDYYEFMAARPDFQTSIHPSSWAGLAVSVRKK